MESLVVSIIVWALLLLGLLGTVVPVLPGVGLVYAGIVLHAVFFGVDTVGFPILITLGVITVFSLILDYLASAYGASRFGSTKWGRLRISYRRGCGRNLPQCAWSGTWDIFWCGGWRNVFRQERYRAVTTCRMGEHTRVSRGHRTQIHPWYRDDSYFCLEDILLMFFVRNIVS